jgi:hypothetical protein
MATAEEVANRLAYEFLRNGNYSAAAGPVEVPSLAQIGAAIVRLMNWCSVVRLSQAWPCNPLGLRKALITPKSIFI